MRLDKFLKVARLAKRRTAAKEALLAGRIEVDGRAAKPSHQVKRGDALLIHYTATDLHVRVLDVPERPGARVRPDSLYEVISERKIKDASP
jgi:ribosomal 50S subunit-recycling heat shock protein